MLVLSAALVATILAQGTSLDTTFAVRPGVRLDVDVAGGSVAVKTWDRATVRVAATHSSRVHVTLAATEAVLLVRSSADRGANNLVDYQIWLPRGTAVALGRGEVDVTAEGELGDVVVDARGGNVRIDGARAVSARVVKGAVTVSRVSGRVEVHTVHGAITLRDLRGEAEVESTNGDIVFHNADLSRVGASSVDGVVTYAGRIRDGGRYVFTTHDHDLRLSLAEVPNATISVATASGGFRSDFPYVVRDQRGRGRFSFALGSGSAQIELESFSGQIVFARSAPAAKSP